MISGNTVNGVIRTTYLRVTSPFSAAGRSLYQGGRNFLLATGRLGAEISAWMLFGVIAVANGIRRAVHAVGAMITLAPRSIIGKAFRLRKFFKTVPYFVVRTLLRSMTGVLDANSTTSTMIARRVLEPYIAIERSTKRFVGRFAGSIGVTYRGVFYNSAATTMTLSFEDGYARLLIFKGDRIIAWRSGQITEPSHSATAVAGTDDESEESAQRPGINPLGPLLEGLPSRSKLVITDLPLHVPLLRHVPVPDVKGRFLKEIVNAEVLNSVPFTQDEVDIQWRIEQSDGIREASVIAIPRNRINDHVRFLRDSQLAPSAIYSKAASLAAAVARPDVFILHMTKDQTAVVLVRGGLPRIVHRLELPRDISEQAESVTMGVGQVAGYHRSQRPDDDVSSLPVVATGELDGAKELLALLATTLDRPIHPFEPEIESPQGFDSADFASNIGLYLAAKSSRSAKIISAQDVLPERHRPAPLPIAPVAVFAGLLMLGFIAFSLAGWVSGVSDDSGPLNATLDIREGQARDVRLATVRQTLISQKIVDANQEALDLVASITSFEQDIDVLLSRINSILQNAESADVELARFVPTIDGFSVSGSAVTYDDVLIYAASMRSSSVFEDATVLQVADSNTGRLGFTIEVTTPKPEDEEGE